jgi:hypothetical protein
MKTFLEFVDAYDKINAHGFVPKVGHSMGRDNGYTNLLFSPEELSNLLTINARATPTSSASMLARPCLGTWYVEHH